jgi:hypothetical protein
MHRLVAPARLDHMVMRPLEQRTQRHAYTAVVVAANSSSSSTTTPKTTTSNPTCPPGGGRDCSGLGQTAYAGCMASLGFIGGAVYQRNGMGEHVAASGYAAADRACTWAANTAYWLCGGTKGGAGGAASSLVRACKWWLPNPGVLCF